MVRPGTLYFDRNCAMGKEESDLMGCNFNYRRFFQDGQNHDPSDRDTCSPPHFIYRNTLDVGGHGRTTVQRNTHGTQFSDWSSFYETQLRIGRKFQVDQLLLIISSSAVDPLFDIIQEPLIDRG